MDRRIGRDGGKILSSSFHVAVHARPADAEAGDPLHCGNNRLATVCMAPDRQAEMWGITFEQASQALSRLPRLFIEPDGALLWVATADEQPAWQLEGNLWDRAGHLVSLELKGHCPETAWDDLLRALGWPATPVIIRLVREAVFVEEPEFRRWAFRSS